MVDNKLHYVVATAIVVKDGKFLITKRSMDEKVSPGKWTVPGGKLELNDYINREKDTAIHWYNILEYLVKREVHEETGLSIKNIKYLTSLTFQRPDGTPTVVISFYAEHAEGSVKLNDESIDHAWVDLAEASKYELIEGIYDEIVMLDKMMKGEDVEEWNKVR